MSERKLNGNHCQCTVCDEYFNSVAAFDKHRTGTHGEDRRCKTPAEMLQAGMAVSNGWWVTALNANPSFTVRARNDDQEKLVVGQRK